jgi:hypothetical protein
MFRRLSRSLGQLFMLPFRLYSFFFPEQPVDHPLADRSLMLLLVLVYQPMPNEHANGNGNELGGTLADGFTTVTGDAWDIAHNSYQV